MNKFERSTRLADKSTKVARETIERGIRSAEEATKRGSSRRVLRRGPELSAGAIRATSTTGME